MSTMIDVQNLGRNYGPIQAVTGLTFQVQKGDVLGFLGPNGAGKSTTMKMLTCFLAPSFGTAKVCGYDIVDDSLSVRSKLGYLPENAPLYGEMRVRDLLRFAGEVRGMKSAALNDAVERVVAETSLAGVMAQRTETLSKGFRRRVGLAVALLHDPEVLILDEPTDGLDPIQKHDVRALIRKMAATKSIILSTHILEEVDEVCNRAIIIAKGKIVADEVPSALRARDDRHGSVMVRFREARSIVQPKLQGLASAKSVQEVLAVDGFAWWQLISDDRTASIGELITLSRNENWIIEDLKIEQGHLDRVFRNAVGLAS